MLMMCVCVCVCVCLSVRQRVIEVAVFLPLIIDVKRGLDCKNSYSHGSSGPDYFTEVPKQVGQ
jgi:hypothetical protein